MVLVAVLLCSFLASSADAATVYRLEGGPFATSGSEPGELGAELRGVAIDDQSGYILISSSNAEISIYEPNGGSPVRVSNSGVVVSSDSIAIGQAERVLYAIESGIVRKFDISGNGPIAFTPDPSFANPSAGFGAHLAVDPTNGDLLVAEAFGGEITRYDPAGNRVSSFSGAGSPGGTFTHITGLSVDAAGSIYVVDVKSDLRFGGANSVLERFASDGTPDSSFAPDIPTPQAVATDPSSGNVVVIGRSDGSGENFHPGIPAFPIRLYTVHGDRIVDELDFPANTAGAFVGGLAAGNGYLYAPTFGDFTSSAPVAAYALKAFKVPDIEEVTIGAVTPFTAPVSGSANPLGQGSSYHFEYSREGGPVESTEPHPLGSGAGQVPISEELTGLIPDSEYEVRLVATTDSTGVSGRSPAAHFTTSSAPPLAVTDEAYDLTRNSATVAGKVNPYGEQTTYRFEYGTTTAYGMQSPVDHGEVAGDGRKPFAAVGYLTGLQPGTEYHYRLTAVNGSGTSVGADHTFITRSLAAAPRVYEQVSPVEKDGGNVNGLRVFSASPDGNRLMYEWKTPPIGTGSGPYEPRSSATRTPSGWTYLPLDPPQLVSDATNGVRILYTQGVSEDGTKVVVNSKKKLAPGAIEGGSNMYLRDTETGEYTTISATPGTLQYNYISNLGNMPIVDGTPDYSHVLLIVPVEPLLPGAPDYALYDYSEGQLHLASVAPDGTPMGNLPMGGIAEGSRHDPHWISEDGSKVFFQSSEGAYVRYNLENTVKIGGAFCGATKDGHYAFVFGHDLTADSEPGVASLYRFDTATQETELLGRTGDEEGCLQVSPNGQSVFFKSREALTPGALASRPNVYVWHDGQIRLVAALAEDANAPDEFMASPDGRYFAFDSYTPLTGYDNSSSTACTDANYGDPGNACREDFRYDAVTQQVLCASCRRDNGPPTGSPHLQVGEVEGDFSFQRSMLDDGTVIFDTPDPLSARDTNSDRDVYTFDGTEQTLISSGFESSISEFDEASADGRDIFFTTQDQLVGQDKDSLADVYDARIGGGIPGQNPPPPRPECIRDDCKATPNQGPELPFGGSEALSGPGNLQGAKADRGCAKGSHARKVKGRTQCVKQADKRKGKKDQKQAKSNRRQGR